MYWGDAAVRADTVAQLGRGGCVVTGPANSTTETVPLPRVA